MDIWMVLVLGEALSLWLGYQIGKAHGMQKMENKRGVKYL